MFFVLKDFQKQPIIWIYVRDAPKIETEEQELLCIALFLNHMQM